ncbi:MAG TPA: TIGR02646 family protein, partial [Polyangium sp.]|nr:TIGR02646 family protein [Polyangium sp.]
QDYTHLDDARKALLEEQGHICCFCMRRIAIRQMKIAHWAPQSLHPDRTMDWTNLMGACPGGDGDRDAVKHCDTAQGDIPIKLNPADRSQQCERFVRYSIDGRVWSEDADINKDLDRTLNLNHAALMRARLAVWSAFVTRMEKQQSRNGQWSPESIEQELAEWLRRDKQGMLREFCQVVIYHLEKKRRRNNR